MSLTERNRKKTSEAFSAADEAVGAYRSGGNRTDPLGSYTGNPAEARAFPDEGSTDAARDFSCPTAHYPGISSRYTARSSMDGGYTDDDDGERPVQDADDL